LLIKKYHWLFTAKYASGFLFRIAYRILEYPVLFPCYCLSLMWFFRRNNFERLMVVNGGYPASLLCRCAVIAWKRVGRRPEAVLNFHNSAIKAPDYISFLENRIDKAVHDSASKIISVSKNCIDSLNNRKTFIGSTKTGFIYNGIADPLLSVVPGKLVEKPVSYILMLATYETRKGHAYLLHAFKMVVREFPYVRLLIYGFSLPAEKQLVRDKVTELSLENNVELNDFSFETTALIANASVLAVPSQSHESFGLTIIEAMAMHTPVVTTDVGGMPEVLANSNSGYVCSKERPEEFAAAITRILSDPFLATALGNNGRKAFEERFLAAEMARHYQSIICT
jgi:glycosyltransferase involved in cell wall biosynthesis